jgi:hypothetical protein
MSPRDRLIGAGVLLAMLGGGVALFLVLSANSAPAAVGAPVTIPIEVDHDFQDTIVTIPVRIRGQRFLFALDTGASTSAVNGTVLRAVGAEDTGEDADYEIASGATESSRLFRIDDWSIGSLQLQRKALVSDLAHPLDVDGLLGSDQLSRLGRVTIDYDAQTLTIAPRKR